MSKDISLFAAIAADIQRAHPREHENRIAAAATLIYSRGLATRDQFGRLQYHPDAYGVAPKLGPAPDVSDLKTAEAKFAAADRLQAWIDGKLVLPRPTQGPVTSMFPEEAKAHAKIVEAERLEIEIAHRLANGGESPYEKMTRELADAEKREGSK